MPLIDPYEAPAHVIAALEWQAKERGVGKDEALSVARLWETLRMEALEDELAAHDALGVQMLDARSHEAIFQRCEEVAREVCTFLRGLLGIPMHEAGERSEWFAAVEQQLEPQVRSRVGVRLGFAILRSLRVAFEADEQGANAYLDPVRFGTRLEGADVLADGVGFDEDEERRRRALWMLELIVRVDRDRPAHPRSIALAADERRMCNRLAERVAAGGTLDRGELADLSYVFEKVQPDWRLYATETGRDEMWAAQRHRALEVIEHLSRDGLADDDAQLLNDLRGALARARDEGRPIDEVLPNASLSTVLRISLGAYEIEPHEELSLPGDAA